jgi:hypothetical protein
MAAGEVAGGAFGAVAGLVAFTVVLPLLSLYVYGDPISPAAPTS